MGQSALRSNPFENRHHEVIADKSIFTQILPDHGDTGR
jgi:hypothetical protein